MTDSDKYLAACHAMQTGVEFKKDKTDQTGKHLRVGVNVAMANHGGLVELLIHKGVITEEEYMSNIRAGMEREVKMYRDEIAKEAGAEPGKISLV